MHKNNLQKHVATAVNTSHCIRIAKILKMAAIEIGGLNEDIQHYNSDISLFSNALQSYSWDNEAGFFSYVNHDSEGNPIEFIKHETGSNYNMGLDGIYPLVAGVCTEDQQTKLMNLLQSEQRLWSSKGLSTVDQSAPYFKIDGYWNGAVWFPHQWFFWKTMLDLGQSDFARKIATTALDLWKNEVEESYNCYEHFIIQSGRGAGWHHFGGLSNPILSWFGAYYIPGRLTCGFDTWVVEKQFNEDNTWLYGKLKSNVELNDRFSIIATMNPTEKYQVKWNNKVVPFKEFEEGSLEITITEDTSVGVLTIEVRQ